MLSRRAVGILLISSGLGLICFGVVKGVPAGPVEVAAPLTPPVAEAVQLAALPTANRNSVVPSAASVQLLGGQRLSGDRPLGHLFDGFHSERQPQGNTYHVAPMNPRQGDGSADNPWRDLQYALCELRPGDRLLLASAKYVGPFAIDGKCRNGHPDLPIEVFAVGTAELWGSISWVPTDEPVVRLARSHWHIHGLKVTPQWSRPAFRIDPELRDIRVTDVHILKGIGDGFDIGHSVRDVVIANAKMHHIGTLRGAQRNFHDPLSAGIRIAPGSTGLSLKNIDMHHLEGVGLLIVPPDDFDSVAGLDEANLLIEAVSARMIHGDWD